MKSFVSALVVAVLVPAAALGDPGSGQDRQNASRACKQLQVEMGASFGQTYRNFGACISKWSQEQHQNRHEAEEACASESRQGGALARCVRAKLAEESAADVQATRNAAKSCKAERKADAASFTAAYGSGRNAYGKCVSKLAQAADAEATP